MGNFKNKAVAAVDRIIAKRYSFGPNFFIGSFMAICPRLSAPRLSTDAVADLIECIKMGDFVVFHLNGKAGRVFHNCTIKQFTPHTEEYLNNVRVIWLNVKRFPELVLFDDLTEIMAKVGCKSCSCPLKARVMKCTGLPFFYSYQF